MKTGLIVYVPESHRRPGPSPADPLDDRYGDWSEPRVIQLTPDRVTLATTEAELAYGWWWLLSRGMRKVECVRATWDGARQAWSPQTEPFRLCG